MNIRMAVADKNRDYAERVSGVLQQYEELTLSVFTNGESLRRAIEENACQIVLFDPDISEEKIHFSDQIMPIALVSDVTQNTGLYDDITKIKKYQRISNIYKEIIRNFSEFAGNDVISFYSGNIAKMMAVYSPVGGCGKTAVAMAVAERLHKEKKRVLFLTTEQINSSVLKFPVKEEGITELVAALNGSTNLELKIKGLIKENEDGIMYLEGFSRIVDYKDVDEKELLDVLRKVRTCNVCDYIVVDTGSCIDALSSAVLHEADRILLVVRNDECAEFKVNSFLEQNIVDIQSGKIFILQNFAERNKPFMNTNGLPVVGMFHHYGNLKIKDLVQSMVQSDAIDLEAVWSKR